MSCNAYSTALASLLKKVRCTPDSSIAFSGGLDSSIVAYLMRECDPVLYTVGFEGSHDVKNAEEIADELGFKLKVIYLSDEMIIEGLRTLMELDRSMSAVELSFELPLLLVSETSEEKRIYSGQGADELFGGYAKYLKHPERMKEDVSNLLNITAKREREIAAAHGKELLTPFLSDEIVSLSLKIPVSCKIKDDVRKYVLREAARQIGVPEIIVNREKKAAQYGSGIWKAMRRMARKSGKSVDEFVRSL